MLQPFDDSPKRLEAVFVQRDNQNLYYDEINISGSDLIVYLDTTGRITADKIPVFVAKYIGNSASASWASSSISASFVPFDGDRAIKRSGYIGLNVGGDDVVEFLDNFFFPFLPATVTINSGTIYYETGSIQSVTINSSITVNDETIFGTGSIRRDGSDFDIWGSIPPYIRGTNDNNISSSHAYQTFVQTDNDGFPALIASSAQNVNFGYPFLWGIDAIPGLTGSALYQATVSHSIFTQQNVGPTPIWGIGTYIYFAYPSNYDDLVSILDPNNFEALPNFEYSASVPVTSSALPTDWMRTYKVYRLRLLASPNGNFTFKFTI